MCPITDLLTPLECWPVHKTNFETTYFDNNPIVLSSPHWPPFCYSYISSISVLLHSHFGQLTSPSSLVWTRGDTPVPGNRYLSRTGIRCHGYVLYVSMATIGCYLLAFLFHVFIAISVGFCTVTCQFCDSWYFVLYCSTHTCLIL